MLSRESQACFSGKAAIELRAKDWHQMTQSGAVELTPWPKVSTRDFPCFAPDSAPPLVNADRAREALVLASFSG